MAIFQTSTLIDVCFAVCTALKLQGNVAVLTGGSAATFYSPQHYQSSDADFIITLGGGTAGLALQTLGFEGVSGMYAHPRTVYTIDFLPPPIAIGNEVIKSWETFGRKGETLYVISRTDSVRDRLAAFYHWDDRSSLATAAGVANDGEIDLDLIRRWSAREGHLAKFDEFSERLRR
jgi:hypothetical protein